MSKSNIQDTLSISRCRTTGLRILAGPEWTVKTEKGFIEISLLENSIIKLILSGFIDLQSTQRVETIINIMLDTHISDHADKIQIIDMERLSGFSLSARANYIKILKNRKKFTGHIYYYTSTMSRLSIRLGRRLNRIKSGFHIVNNYEEAVNLSLKILSSKIPAADIHMDTTQIPFAFTKPVDICRVTGLKITRKPEWERIRISKNYYVSFSIYGDNLLFTKGEGKATPENFIHFLDKRDEIINTFFKNKPFCEIKNFADIKAPSGKLRKIFSDRLTTGNNDLAGLFCYNVPRRIKSAIIAGTRVVRPAFPVKVVSDFETAVSMAFKTVTCYTETGNHPDHNLFSSAIETPQIISMSQLKFFEDELLRFLGSINWELQGSGKSLENIPQEHPFRLVFEAIGLVKSDLDSLAFEQSKANRARLESEKLYKLLAENTHDVIWISDLSLKPLFISPSMKRLSGYSIDDLMEMDFSQTLTPACAKSSLQILDDELKKEASGKYDSTRSVLIELENIHKEGTIYWSEAKVSFLRDGKGKATGIIGVTRNISERKTAEAAAKKSSTALRQTQDQLIQAEKMAALGGLVAGVSHEISTPLGVSVTASSFLNHKAEEFYTLVKDGKATKNDIDKFTSIALESTALISNNLQRSAELINSFKQVAVDQSTEAKRTFNVKDYIEEVLQSLIPNIKRTEHIIRFECPDDIIINSFPGAFSQIFTNLIMNSFLHGFENIAKGTIKIAIDVDIDALQIKYSDDGNGMETDVLQQLYNPFYTTRRGSGGTGLGMHITYNIITRKLNGTISCMSSPGKGTTFFIKLHH